MTASRILAALAGLLGTLLVTTTAIAAVPVTERASMTGGFGAWLIDSLFEAGTLSTMPSNSGMIGSIIQPFSLACMLVVVFIIIFKSVQHVLIVAQAKDPESSPIALTWAPLHLVFAVALAMPMPSGYSMGQYAAIWVAQKSNMLGNVISERVVSGEEYTVFTEVPLPHVRETVLSLVEAQMCRIISNEIGQYTESQGGSGMQVQAKELTSGQLQNMFGLTSATVSSSSSVSRAGVAFNLDRTGPGGDFLGKTGEVNDFCGSIMVEHTANYDSKDVDLTPSPGADCDSGIVCAENITEFTKETSKTKERELVANAFKGAHESISKRFLNMARSSGGNVGAAAEALTFDMRTYFDGLTDDQAMAQYQQDQATVPLKIAEASNAVVTEITDFQNSVYAAYGGALNALRSPGSTGDSHADAVMKSGWTVLGLYWFQQQSFNSQVLDAVNLKTVTRMDMNRLAGKIEQATNDTALANRIVERAKALRASVNRQIMNTRLDDNPISTASGGDRAIEQSINASSIRDTLPTYLSSMIDSAEAGQGATTADAESYAGFSPSGFVRETIFPFMVRALRGDDNVVTGLVNLGHYLIIVAEVAYGAELLLRTTAEWAEEGRKEGTVKKVVDRFTNPGAQAVQTGAKWAVASWVGILLKNFLSDLKPLVLYMFFLGIFLAFYLPAVVMIQWIIGLVQWLLYIVEATIVIPLWAILFASDMGQKAFAPQTAQQGLIHLVSILLYPALMIIGFVIGLKILDLASYFLIDYIVLGFLNITSGPSFGIVSVFAGLTLVGLIAYQVIMRVFSGMLELNDRAIGWIGNRASFGENQTEQAARSAMVAVISRGESMGHRAATGKKMPGIGGGPKGQ